MDLDDVMPVENLSDITLQLLAERLARTRTAEQCIYRESELDELWRLIDVARRAGDPEGLRDAGTLERMRIAVHQAHDLVGMEGKPKEAADALRRAMTG